MNDTYEYHHSKLKIIGCLGMFSMVILVPIAVFIFNIHGIENAVLTGAYMAFFGLLMMVGMLNEG